MKIIVITSGSYPYGNAATNRHISYLKGLVELGVEVKLLILQRANKQSSLSNKAAGVFEGIEFEYITWKVITDRTLCNKIIVKLVAIYCGIKKLKKIIRGSNTHTRIIVLLTNPFEIYPFLKVGKRNNIPVFHERTEFPFINKKGIIEILVLKFYLKSIIPQFDGIFVITHALIDYFKPYLASQKKILLLPMVVDIKRFTDGSRQIKNLGKYIAYCGSMYTDKDGVPDLIEIFNQFCMSNDEFNLVLIGDNSNTRLFRHIAALIDKSPYKQRIFCLGQIESTKIPYYLNAATMLVLARPDNIQAQGGFPTKLGEYLATGNPVVITDVGEHSLYLKDDISAYLVPPGNKYLFCKRLLDVANDTKHARAVGLEGKKVALEHFDYKVIAQRLLLFINSDEYLKR